MAQRRGVETIADCRVWNQIPATLGNLVGGFLFTGLAIYTTYKPAAAVEKAAVAKPSRVPAE